MLSPITILWFISSILACWSFSLLIRLISEAVAHKRKRLVTQRTRKSVRLAFVLMAITLLASIVAGAAAVFEQSSRDSYYSGGPSVVAAIGGSVGLFAVCLIIWAAVGDRSRGRVRCPKCWYDMSDSIGLKCPECGDTAKDRKSYSKSRRPRWAFILGGVMLLFGGIGVGLDERVQEDGYLSIMPNWLMLMTWESLPDNWVYTTGTKNVDSNLATRINLHEVSTTSTRELGEKLFDRMINDIDARWDPKNHALLHAIYGRSKRDWYNKKDNPKIFWTPPENKLEQLFLLSARDVLDALLSPNPTALETKILTTNMQRYAGYVDVYALCKDWIVSREIPFYPYNSYKRFYILDSIELFDAVQAALIDFHKDSQTLDLIRLFQGQDTTRQTRAVMFLIDVGVTDAYLDQYYSTWSTTNSYTKQLVLLSHAMAIRTTDQTKALSEYDELTSYISSTDTSKREYALSMMVPMSRVKPSKNPDIIQARHRLTESAYEIFLKYNTDDYSVDSLMRDLAVEAITAFDDTGLYSFQVISKLMEQTGTVPDSIDEQMSYLYDDTDVRVENWIEHFEPISHIQSPTLQSWIAQNCPERSGTPSDQRIDEMLIRLEQLEDVDVSNSAFLTQSRRRSYQDRMSE